MATVEDRPRIRRLHLLRHVKSSWDDKSLRDHARPLAPRGEAAGQALARYFTEQALTVDLALVSTAVRTRRTWELVSSGVSGTPQVTYTDDIYDATADELLALVRGVPESVHELLLVGHNPGTGELAAGLNSDPDSSAARRMADKYPTGGFATLAVPASWAQLGYGRAVLESFVRPRDLPPA